jgi:hypothetical protein
MRRLWVWAGTMNTIYLVTMMDECVRTFNSETSKRVCDLVPSKTLILFLSTPATRQLTLGPRDAGFAQAPRLRICCRHAHLCSHARLQAGARRGHKVCYGRK